MADRSRPALLCTFLLLLLAGCGSDSPSAKLAAETGPLVHFPADQAAHPNAHNEWWYVVGHLHAGSQTFGFETTIFKFAHMVPPGFTTPVTLYRTDMAITDQTNHRFYHAITTYFPQSASLSAAGLNARVGAAGLSGPPHHMTLDARFAPQAIHLTLNSRRGPMYVGGRGYLPFGNGYTYYYSLTDLATQGTLRLRGKTYHVSGISWLDHQWGNWSWRAIHGWTWMALQMGNGVQLSLFDFRGAQHVKAASVLLTSGLRTLRNVTITPTGYWRSPHTHALYPSGWTVRIPALRAIFTVTPSVRDQEMTVSGSLGASYWEGSGQVRGTMQGKTVTGLSYTELTGYAAHANGVP